MSAGGGGRWGTLCLLRCEYMLEEGTMREPVTGEDKVLCLCVCVCVCVYYTIL